MDTKEVHTTLSLTNIFVLVYFHAALQPRVFFRVPLSLYGGKSDTIIDSWSKNGNAVKII